MVNEFNNYLSSKITSFLECLLTLLGFVSCGDEESVEDPSRVAYLYGSPYPTVGVINRTTGFVFNEDSVPLENIKIKSIPVKKNAEENDTLLYAHETYTNDRGRYKVTFYDGNMYVNVRDAYDKIRVVASDTSGVYENDTMYVDYDVTTQYYNQFDLETKANFTLHKKEK